MRRRRRRAGRPAGPGGLSASGGRSRLTSVGQNCRWGFLASWSPGWSRRPVFPLGRPPGHLERRSGREEPVSAHRLRHLRRARRRVRRLRRHLPARDAPVIAGARPGPTSDDEAAGALQVLAEPAWCRRCGWPGRVSGGRRPDAQVTQSSDCRVIQVTGQRGISSGSRHGAFDLIPAPDLPSVVAGARTAAAPPGRRWAPPSNPGRRSSASGSRGTTSPGVNRARTSCRRAPSPPEPVSSPGRRTRKKESRLRGDQSCTCPHPGHAPVRRCRVDPLVMASPRSCRSRPSPTRAPPSSRSRPVWTRSTSRPRPRPRSATSSTPRSPRPAQADRKVRTRIADAERRP